MWMWFKYIATVNPVYEGHHLNIPNIHAESLVYKVHLSTETTIPYFPKQSLLLFHTIYSIHRAVPSGDDASAVGVIMPRCVAQHRHTVVW